MTTNDPILVALAETNRLLEANHTALVEIRDAFRALGNPEPTPEGCQHPVEFHEDCSSMGEKWIRCKLCKDDIVREDKTGRSS